jgi:glutathione S-transferase
MTAAIELFELGGTGARRYSLFSWRARLALAHKGLAFESRPVKVTDKAAIAFSGQKRVPIIRHGAAVVFDSWRIAEHLEDAFPDRPSLFAGPGGRALARFVNFWVDRTLVPAVGPTIAAAIPGCVEPDDGAHIRAGFEKGFGTTLEEMWAAREAGLKRLHAALDPVRALVKAQPFLGGDAPLYADYIVASPFQWARVVCAEPVLSPDDPVAAWFERVLDLHGGLARAEPARRATP